MKNTTTLIFVTLAFFLFIQIISAQEIKDHRLTIIKNKHTLLKVEVAVFPFTDYLLKEKNDTRIVQEFAGHRRTSSTEAYKQSGLEELKQAINKFHPLQ